MPDVVVTGTGLVMDSSGPSLRPYVPPDPALRTMLLHEHHDTPTAGHFGLNRTLERLAGDQFYPDMKGCVDEHVRSCGVCQRAKPSTQCCTPAAKDFLATLNHALASARTHLNHAQKAQKRAADKRRRPHMITVGDQVLLSTRNLPLKGSGQTPKLHPKYIGPFKVTAQVGKPNAFCLELPPQCYRLHPVSNVDMLRPHREDLTAFPTREVITRPLLEITTTGPEFEVEAIVDKTSSLSVASVCHATLLSGQATLTLDNTLGSRHITCTTHEHLCNPLSRRAHVKGGRDLSLPSRLASLPTPPLSSLVCVHLAFALPWYLVATVSLATALLWYHVAYPSVTSPHVTLVPFSTCFSGAMLARHFILATLPPFHRQAMCRRPACCIRRRTAFPHGSTPLDSGVTGTLSQVQPRVTLNHRTHATVLTALLAPGCVAPVSTNNPSVSWGLGPNVGRGHTFHPSDLVQQQLAV
jgi:hypothetical protein